MHCASLTDNNESFEIGKPAVKHAINNETGKMMVFKRLNTPDYQIEIDAIDVSNAANLEKKVPVEWINEKGNDIMPSFYMNI